ncbi:MAG: hypothetical protein ACREQA_22230 [Candidatus Binatia bacterium]
MRKIGLPTSALYSVLVYAFINGCTPTMSSVNPPENYKGPVAEGSKLQAEDFWIYERADGRRVKLGAGTFLSHLSFPLWVGKTWKYPSEAIRGGVDPTTSRETRVSVEVECEVTSFKEMAVTAGTFEAFECRCQCTVHSSAYEPDCGQWTVWYAPKAKNIIRIKTESTATTLELVEYDVSGKVTRPTPARRAPPECLDPESRKKFPILCGSY